MSEYSELLRKTGLRQCFRSNGTSKKRYDTMQEAEYAARDHGNRYGGKRYHAYLCENCKKYHIGKLY